MYWCIARRTTRRLIAAPALDLRTGRSIALPGLPIVRPRYAGRYYWARGSVRTNSHWLRYSAELSDTNVARFLLTHPGRLLSIGQKAAIKAQSFRVTQLGT